MGGASVLLGMWLLGITVGLSFVNVARGQQQIFVTLSGSLPAISATYSDLKNLATYVEGAVQRIPMRTETPCSFSYQVDRGKAALTANSFNALVSESDLPNPATGFHLDFICSARTAVFIAFTDSSSSYNLRGSDKAVLVALHARIQEFADE